MDDRARSASVTLDYGRNGDGSFAGQIVSVRLLSAPPPLVDFVLPEAPGGAWLDVAAPGASGPSFRLPLPDPRQGQEVVTDDDRMARLAPENGERRTAAFEVPWYGEGTRITLRLGTGERLDSRAQSGAFTLSLSVDQARGAKFPPAEAIKRWGHENPRALCLVFLGEAFTADERATFDTAVAACLDALEAVPPLTGLLRALRPLKLLIPSKISGITAAPQKTPFGGYWRSASADERVIMVDERKVAPVFAHVAGKSSAQAVVIANSDRYGGSGGASAVVSRHVASMQGVLVHELGHSLFGLADEYSAASGYTVDGAPIFPNVSGPFTPETLKWADMVSQGAPLPTPAVAPFPAVGAFEGAMYKDTLRYRPSHNCRMRDISAPFCPVCTRQIERRLSPHL